MKKDLSVFAKGLFPNLEKNTYKRLMSYYQGVVGKPDIRPKLTLNEAVSKYTSYVQNVVENKRNWKHDDHFIFVDFSNPYEVFSEFFPRYRSDSGHLYMAISNHCNGEKIVCFLITKIFYLNYTGMEIRDIYFTKRSSRSFLQNIIRISLRMPDQ